MKKINTGRSNQSITLVLEVGKPVSDSTRGEQNQVSVKEFRRLQMFICRVFIWIHYFEGLLVLFDCVFGIYRKAYEVKRQMICLVHRDLRTVLVYAGLLLLDSTNKQKYFGQLTEYMKTDYLLEESLVKRICQICQKQQIIRFFCLQCRICTLCQQNVLYHSELLQICLTKQLVRFYQKHTLFSILKCICLGGYRVYSFLRFPFNQNSPINELFFASSISGLFLNIILFILEIYFLKLFISEKHQFEKLNLIQPPLIHQVNQVDKQQLIEIVEEPEQIPIRKKLTLNVNQNNDSIISIHELRRDQSKKSSMSPSPGRYRSGKILDFLEKKLSHAKSQSSLGQSRKKIYITDHIVSRDSLEMGSDSESIRVCDKLRQLDLSRIKHFPK